MLGANGLLGQRIYEELKSDMTLEVVGASRSNFGSLKFLSLRRNYIKSILNSVAPNIIINCVGLNPQKSKYMKFENLRLLRVNSHFPRVLAKAALIRDISIIHISTNGVFNNSQGVCLETTKAIPRTAYGLSKKMGESKLPNVINIRCSFIGKNEIESSDPYLLEQVIKLPKGSTIQGYTNQKWNGVTTTALARIIKTFCTQNIKLPNILHIVPSDVISKYELLQLISITNSDDPVTIYKHQSTQPSSLELASNNGSLLLKIWRASGYKQVPSIKTLVNELLNKLK